MDKVEFPMLEYDTNVTDKLQRDEVLDYVTAVLKKDMNLTVLKIEAKGENGHVIATQTRNGLKENLAVKIISNINVSEGERAFWPRLKHSNILPMLQYDYLQPLRMHVFISPMMGCSMEQVLGKNFFLKRDKSFLFTVKKWIKELLEAVDYLHKKGFCHLGIKPSNVLVSNDLRAIVGDFHYLNAITDSPARYGLSFEERPPEVWLGEADGIATDVWSIGLLALKLFTGESLIKKNKSDKFHGWSLDVYPHLFVMMQNKSFKQKCKKAFPVNEISTETAKQMVNFVTSCLRICPSDRPSIEALKRHLFLDNKGSMEKPDIVWLKKEKGKNFDHKMAVTKDKRSYVKTIDDSTKEIILAKTLAEEIEEISKLVPGEDSLRERVVHSPRAVYGEAKANSSNTGQFSQNTDEQCQIENEPNLAGDKVFEMSVQKVGKQKRSEHEEANETALSPDKTLENSDIKNPNIGCLNKIRGWFIEKFSGVRNLCCLGGEQENEKAETCLESMKRNQNDVCCVSPKKGSPVKELH